MKIPGMCGVFLSVRSAGILEEPERTLGSSHGNGLWGGCDSKGFPLVFPLEAAKTHPRLGASQKNRDGESREAPAASGSCQHSRGWNFWEQLEKIRNVQSGRFFPEFSKGFPSPFCAGNFSLVNHGKAGIQIKSQLDLSGTGWPRSVQLEFQGFFRMFSRICRELPALAPQSLE